MGIRNRIIEKVCSTLRILKRNEFNIKFREEFGAPEENTKELLEMVTRDFSSIRDRDDETNLFIGRFFGIILLIEAKLESLLMKVDPAIETKMLGRKISIFKKLIKELKKNTDGFDIETYNKLLKPLSEVSKIRNKMAHNLNYTKFDLSEVPFTIEIVKELKPDLFLGVSSAPIELRALVLISIFGFIISEKTSMLNHSLA